MRVDTQRIRRDVCGRPQVRELSRELTMFQIELYGEVVVDAGLLLLDLSVFKFREKKSREVP